MRNRYLRFSRAISSYALKKIGKKNVIDEEISIVVFEKINDTWKLKKLMVSLLSALEYPSLSSNSFLRIFRFVKTWNIDLK